jgi:hypothetical protein
MFRANIPAVTCKSVTNNPTSNGQNQGLIDDIHEQKYNATILKRISILNAFYSEIFSQ